MGRWVGGWVGGWVGEWVGGWVWVGREKRKIVNMKRM
jgi:hypothetical protein